MKRSKHPQQQGHASATTSLATRESTRAPAQAKVSAPQPIRVHRGPGTAADRQSDGATVLSADERRAVIAQAAYFRAESRGFEPGHELEDWVAAELQVDELLHESPRAPTRQESLPQAADQSGS